jgi:hypothetical protein
VCAVSKGEIQEIRKGNIMISEDLSVYSQRKEHEQGKCIRFHSCVSEEQFTDVAHCTKEAIF